MGTNNKDYMRIYQKNRRAGDDMQDNIYQAEWTADIKPQQLKKAYKGKIETEEHKLLFNNALILVNLIQASKTCLEAEGVYIKTITGLVKENPRHRHV